MGHKNLVLENNKKILSYQIIDPIKRAHVWRKEQKEIEILKQKIKNFETMTGSRNTLDLGVIAKVINKKGYGRKKLFEFLKIKKILMQNNQPYQKYIDNGCFRTIETKFIKSNGNISINIKTVVYQKGVDLISKLLDKNL